MGVIDLFDTLWIYEAASQVWESNKAQLWANKQVAIQLDTSQRLKKNLSLFYSRHVEEEWRVQLKQSGEHTEQQWQPNSRQIPHHIADRTGEDGEILWGNTPKFVKSIVYVDI